MINQTRDAPIGVELGVLGILVLILVEIKEFGLVHEFEFVKNKGNLPVNTNFIRVTGQTQYVQEKFTTH